MAIEQGVCISYKSEIVQGIHNTTTHEYYIALFTDSATIGKNTTTYTGLTGEVANGNGYTTGGQKLENGTVTVDGDTIIVDFNDVIWSSSSFTARGALIYNYTLAGKNAVGVLDFSQNYTSNNGDFKIIFPAPTASTALLRIV